MHKNTVPWIGDGGNWGMEVGAGRFRIPTYAYGLVEPLTLGSTAGRELLFPWPKSKSKPKPKPKERKWVSGPTDR